MSEPQRGCGHRKVGGLYLVCDGIAVACDGLPLKIEPCECCGFEPTFSRNIQRLNYQYVKARSIEKHWNDTPEKAKPDLQMWKDRQKLCTCGDSCPICHAEEQAGTKALKPIQYGLMHVGKTYYTPQSFIKEAMSMGISKRIPDIPSWLVLNKTWILLVHDEVPDITLEELKKNNFQMKEPKKHRAIFYAFRPQRIELLLWKNQYVDDTILELEKRGITVKLIEKTKRNMKFHKEIETSRDLVQRLLKKPELKEK